MSTFLLWVILIYCKTLLLEIDRKWHRNKNFDSNLKLFDNLNFPNFGRTVDGYLVYQYSASSWIVADLYDAFRVYIAAISQRTIFWLVAQPVHKCVFFNVLFYSRAMPKYWKSKQTADEIVTTTSIIVTSMASFVVTSSSMHLFEKQKNLVTTAVGLHDLVDLSKRGTEPLRWSPYDIMLELFYIYWHLY